MSNEHLINQLRQENKQLKEENNELRNRVHELLKQPSDDMTYWYDKGRQDEADAHTQNRNCACTAEEDSSPYKVKLEFNMPQARDDLTLALKGPDCFFIMHTLHEDFRQKLKHGELSDVEDRTLSWVMDKLHEEMDDKQITLDMVT